MICVSTKVKIRLPFSRRGLSRRKEIVDNNEEEEKDEQIENREQVEHKEKIEPPSDTSLSNDKK
jgi:hypothetical protein